MSSARDSLVIAACALLSTVDAHGLVQGIVAGGSWYKGYCPSNQYLNPVPVVAGWTAQNQDNGFVSDYTHPDMICHKGATPGGAYVTVAAGSSVLLQWTPWPDSHHGPVIDYLAPCGGDCRTVDKTKLLLTKISEVGLVDSTDAPGVWAADQLIAANNSWTVTIPASIAPGKYVLRHEIIALHGAYEAGGAQNYPQCVNVEITGAGTNALSGGTLGSQLYNIQDPGLLINIYWPKVTSYTIPGPPLIGGAATNSPTGSTVATTTRASPTSPSTTASSSANPPTSVTSSAPSTCATNWSQCGGVGWKGSTCCSNDWVCTYGNDWYWQCLASANSAGTSSRPPVPSSSTTAPTSCAAKWGQCGGIGWNGPTCCADAWVCSYGNDWYWQCLAPASVSDPPSPASASTSASTAGVTGALSFMSTVTGRLGQPTKYVCYVVE